MSHHPRPPEPLEETINELTTDGSADQDLRDQVHARLWARCQVDHDTECWIYTGSWDKRGIAKVRVGQRSYTVSRVSAWLYLAGFELWDARWVYHGESCENPACFNFAHLEIAQTKALGLEALRALGRWGSHSGRGRTQRPGRRLNRQKASDILSALSLGANPAELAKIHGVRTEAIVMIGDRRTWASAGHGLVVPRYATQIAPDVDLAAVICE